MSAGRLGARVAVITGAAGGIGGAIAGALAGEGCGLVLGDQAAAREALEGVAASARGAGVKAITLAGDVTRAEDMVALAGRAVAEFGRLDILVTCAGIDSPGLLAEQDEPTWARVIDINLCGTYRAVRAALSQMMAQREGRIVTISSSFGRTGGFGYITAYAASKHGVLGLTRALAMELGSQGFPAITVNAICPGYVRAGMGLRMQSTKAGPMSGADIFERYYKRQTAQRRMVEPAEIAQAAVFLVLPESAAITGQALNVDAGFIMS